MTCTTATTGTDVTGTSWILNSSDKPKIPDPTSEQSARAAPPPPSRRRRLTPPPLLPLPSLLSPLWGQTSASRCLREQLCAPQIPDSLCPKEPDQLSSRSLPARCRGKGETKRRASSCTRTNPVTELISAGNYGQDTWNPELISAGNYGQDTWNRFRLRVALDFRTWNPVSSTQIPRQQPCSPPHWEPPDLWPRAVEFTWEVT